jgi:L-ribulose-5-phosphate 3-epimerase
MATMSNAAKMNTLGIMSYVYGDLPAHEMARDIQAHGIRFVQVDPRQRGLLDQQGQMSAQRAADIRSIFASCGISIPVLSGYMNLLDPDLQRRESNLQKMEEMIDLCPAFGATAIATETGSLHPTNQWGDHPDNQSEKAWEALLEVTERLRKRAADKGVTLLLEGYVNNVLSSAEKAAKLMQEMGGQGLGLVMDPFNYMKQEHLEQQEAALDHIFDSISAFSTIAHAKDTIYTEKGIKTPRAGTGLVQWELVAEHMCRQMPDALLFMEHLQPGEVAECIAFIQGAYHNCGTEAKT